MPWAATWLNGCFDRAQPINLTASPDASGRPLLVDEIGGWSLGWTDEAVFVADFDVNPYLEAIAAEDEAAWRRLPDPKVAISLFAEAALPLVPDATLPPRPSDAPYDPDEPTPDPDPSLEALMPNRIGSTQLTVQSFAYLRDQDLSHLPLGLPFVVLLPQLVAPGSDLAIAIVGVEESTFSIWAIRVGGHTGAELLGSSLGQHAVMGAACRAFTGNVVDGRRYTTSDDWALYAQGDVLYWMLYFDMGDCFDDCDPGTRAPLAEMVREAVLALPEP